MMKDRIGNKLGMGDKVVVALPEAQIFGFVAQLEEGGIITGVRGARGGVEQRPGRILVSCVIALPVDSEYDSVAQIVKVHDPDKHETGETAERPN
jgi:DNA-binding IscR family transcriptional regulator